MKPEFVISLLPQIEKLSLPPRFTKTYGSEGLRIHTTDSLPVTTLKCRSGTTLFILGWMILDTELVTDTFDYSIDATTGDEIWNSDLYRFATGRFLVVVQSRDKEVLLVPDASGSLSACVSSKFSVCVSEPDLYRELGFDTADLELHTEIERICDANGYWFAGGFTPYRGLTILLPNHVYGMSRRQSTRVWPPPDFCGNKLPRVDVAQATTEVYQLMSGLFRVIDQYHPLALPITGGRDSRILLAVLFASDVRNISCFTNGSPDSPDASSGKTLARSCGYSWKCAQPSNKDVVCTGFGGEIVKGYWLRSLTSNSPDRAERIYDAMPFTSTIAASEIKDAITTKIRELMTLRLADDVILDILYLELRWACTMGQVQYRKDEESLFSLSPFSCRRIIELGIALPLANKWRMDFSSVMLSRYSPHLQWLPAGGAEYSGKQFLKLIAAAPFCLVPGFQSSRRVIFSQPACKGVWATLKLHFMSARRYLGL